MSDENIVKNVCKDLGMTYRELGEIIGVSESSLRSSASTGKISDQVSKAIQLYLETLDLKNQLKACETLKKALKELIK